MSVSKAALAPPVASTIAPDRVASKIILALTIAEGKRFLRHPVLLAGAALGAWFSIQPWLHGQPAQDWDTQNYETFLLPWAPLYLAAFIVANIAALRERETTTAEMFRSSPTRYSERTMALLAAGLVPTTLAALLGAIHQGFIAHVGGITVGNQQVQLTPTMVEMALVPATTAVAFAAGVALARTVRSRTLGVVFGAITTWLTLWYWAFAWFPTYFLAPYTTSLRSVDLGQDLTEDELTNLPMVNAPSYHEEARWQVLVRDIQSVGWHNVYLIGLGLLLATYAVWRSGRDLRVRWLLLPGAALTIGGLALQMASFGAPFNWWEAMHGLEGL